MKPIQSKLHLLIPLVMMISLLAAILPLGQSAFAQEDLTPEIAGAGDTPTLISPLGTITEQTPTFTWSKVFGTSSYQYQVWRGSTKVLDKTVGYSVCASDTCSVKSTLKLDYGAYTWRVRAYVLGVWKPWSEYAGFMVSGPSFKAGFNYTMSGWLRKSGAAWKTAPTAIYTNGKADYWTSVYRPVSHYVDFDYSVRMKRTGGTFEGTWYPAQYVAVRMGGSVNAANAAWYPGYIFGYRDDGFYSIWEYDSTSAVSVIQPWTESTAIVPYDWNILRVVAYGDSYDYYINGTLVYSFSESIRAKGFVGVEMYARAGATFTKLQVDWARLTIADASAVVLPLLDDSKTREPAQSGESPQGGTR